MRPPQGTELRKCAKSVSWFGSFGRIEFTAPRQTVDVDAQRIAAQLFFGARRLQDDRHNRRPALQSSGCAVDIATLGPAHVERRIAGAHDAGDLRRYRL